MESDEFKVPSTCIVRNTLNENKKSLLGDGIEFSYTISAKFLDIVAIKLFISKGYEFLVVNHKVQPWPKKMLLFEKGQLCPWTSQLFMYKGRLQNCLKNLCWDENSSVETHVSVFNFLNNSLVFPEKKISSLFLVWKKKLHCEYNHLPKTNGYQIDGIPADDSKILHALRYQKLSGIYTYKIFKDMDRENLLKLADKLQGPGFSGDFADRAFWHLVSNDFLALKQMFSPIIKKGDKRRDSILASLKLARSNKCYEDVLKDLTPEGKVKMSKPGEVSFFPIKHCRWCGLVEVKKFRVCSLCKEIPDYPDLNLFCSEKCESESLAEQHEEEHATFLMVKLGLI